MPEKKQGLYDSALDSIVGATSLQVPTKGSLAAGCHDKSRTQSTESTPSGSNTDISSKIGLEIDKARTGAFWHYYFYFDEDKQHSQEGRRSALMHLIRLARIQQEWDAIERIFKLWGERGWGIDPTLEHALVDQAVKYMQLPILLRLVEKCYIRIPSSRKARHVAQAIITPHTASPLFFPDRLLGLLNFTRITSDPQILSSRRASHKSQPVPPTDDIVIGTLTLAALLQAVGDAAFNLDVRRKFAYTALKLDLRLRSWRERGLDGSGPDAVSLAQDEKWWAYIATMECCAALRSSEVEEVLASVWQESKEAKFIGKPTKGWSVKAMLGTAGSETWMAHRNGMIQWLKEATAIFESRG